MTTAFELDGDSLDPKGDGGDGGACGISLLDEEMQPTSEDLPVGNVGAVLIETGRDVFETLSGLGVSSLEELYARTITHEIGHQFGLTHSSSGIMLPEIMQMSDGDFFFDPVDIDFLRNQIDSPGPS